ncbi:MAG TPA: BON domain-containing protein [Cellvibrio sp.]|nr:BON domain-containing protein [Cellvibrio sp.]
MFNLSKKFLITSVIASTLISLSSFTYADAKQDLLEARQETQIWTTYALSPYLRAHEITVDVDNGKATLSGKVDEDVNKELAKQIALGVSGIKEVDNKIMVQADYVPKASTQNYGQVIDDATVTAAVKARLAWSKHVDGSAVKVETKAGRVTLTGEVANAEIKESVKRLTIGTRGVVSVTNQLTVNSKIAKSSAESTQVISDAWITTKAKSIFFYSGNVSGSDIEVNTLNGVVTLKGKVDSGAERALAIELVQNLRGVKSVNAKDLVF